jgi:hypothetical protein
VGRASLNVSFAPKAIQVSRQPKWRARSGAKIYNFEPEVKSTSAARGSSTVGSLSRQRAIHGKNCPSASRCAIHVYCRAGAVDFRDCSSNRYPHVGMDANLRSALMNSARSCDLDRVDPDVRALFRGAGANYPSAQNGGDVLNAGCAPVQTQRQASPQPQLPPTC